MATQNEFGNIADFAKFIGVSRRTAQALVTEGKIPHYRLGPQTVRINFTEALEALRAQSVFQASAA